MRRSVYSPPGPLPPKTQRIRFWLFISADEFMRYYQGEAVSVSVVADDGRRIQFPAHHLRKVIQHDGIRGHFELTLDADNRFVSLTRI